MKKRYLLAAAFAALIWSGGGAKASAPLFDMYAGAVHRPLKPAAVRHYRHRHHAYRHHRRHHAHRRHRARHYAHRPVRAPRAVAYHFDGGLGAPNPYAFSVGSAAAGIGMIPAYVRGSLVCAVNVGRYLATNGIQGTGSAWARSYTTWGRPSAAVPGAVAVFSRGRRGGHVAIIHHVDASGAIHYLNPSTRRGWRVVALRKRPIAIRVAGL